MIRDRLEKEIGSENLLTKNQFGFRKGLKTTNAINHLLQRIKKLSFCKYTLIVFIDIERAFDSVWWPAVIQELRQIKAPNNLVKLIQSYFHSRVIEFKAKHVGTSKTATKGCPQGSVLGPFLWNLVMNSLLREEFEDGCEIIAYADDIAAIVSGKTKSEIEQRTKTTVSKIEKWAYCNKLILSKEKSQCMVMGGTLLRNPTVKIYGRQIKRCKAYKYLGVVMDEKLNFQDHCNYLNKKVRNIYQGVRRHCKSVYGIKSLDKMYTGVVLPISTYAADVWGHRVEYSRDSRKLRGLQRNCLLSIANSYSTVSTDALNVLTHHPPLKFEINTLNYNLILVSKSIIRN
jgi:hypothetical protein